MKIENLIFENGMDYLLMSGNYLAKALEGTDLNTKNKNKKYSILHLSSGIELIFKYRLFLEHWTFIFSDLDQASLQKLMTSDFESVNSFNNINRLGKLCNIVIKKSDIETLKKLRKIRNRYEHFIVSEGEYGSLPVIIESFTFIIEFIKENILLKFEDIEKNRLVDDLMLNVASITEIDFKRQERIESYIKDKNLCNQVNICPLCENEYLIVENSVCKCLYCDYQDSSKSTAEIYIEIVLGISGIDCAINGGLFPQYCCPRCLEETLVVDHDKKDIRCFGCNAQINYANVGYCDQCGCVVESDNLDEGVICKMCLINLLDDN